MVFREYPWRLGRALRTAEMFATIGHELTFRTSFITFPAPKNQADFADLANNSKPGQDAEFATRSAPMDSRLFDVTALAAADCRWKQSGSRSNHGSRRPATTKKGRIRRSKIGHRRQDHVVYQGFGAK